MYDSHILRFFFVCFSRSTDFEVHRNWLAITHSLPISKWYFEDTSEWTLDYPPLFAWFERFLSTFAAFFDREMLRVDNLNYASNATIVFQRTSVIVSDFVFVYAVSEWTKILAGKMRVKMDYFYSSGFPLVVLLLVNPGLIMLDHIHFQYNGFLYGFLLLALARIFQDRPVSAAVYFSILLNLKHLYIYVAPAFFVYLLRSYCLKPGNNPGQALVNLVKLGSVVVAVFFVSFAPFLEKVFSRLFPVKRGLCHAYWAPNVWALYAAADKMLTVVAPRFGLSVVKANASMTGGLVQEYQFAVLPQVGMLTTMVLTICAQLPALYDVWRRPGDYWAFLRCVTLCAFASFLFGYHVHEKAILMAILPAVLLAFQSSNNATMYIILSTAGHYSIFPLLFGYNELPIKVCLVGMHAVYGIAALQQQYNVSNLLSRLEKSYVFGFVVLLCVTEVLPFTAVGKRLPFLALMLTSVYCSLGIIYSWVLLSSWTSTDRPRSTSRKERIH